MTNLTATEMEVLSEVTNADGLYEEPRDAAARGALARLTKSRLVKRYKCRAIKTFGNPEGWAYRATAMGKRASRVQARRE